MSNKINDLLEKFNLTLDDLNNKTTIIYLEHKIVDMSEETQINDSQIILIRLILIMFLLYILHRIG